MRNVVKRAALALPPARRVITHRDRLARERLELAGEAGRLRADLDQTRTVLEAARAEVRLERRRAAYAEAALGQARRALVDPDPDPASHYQFLFFLTYGRSGTTLLQGILSANPGVLIRGENGDALYGLYQFHRAALDARDRLTELPRHTVESPWWGIDCYPEKLALQGIRRLVVDTLIKPEPDSSIIGFKEIRWVNRKDFVDLVEFIATAFPGARFLLNTRNHDEVAKSKWFAEDPDVMDRLALFESRLAEAEAMLGDAVYRVHYNDYKDDPEALRGLHEWLGLEFSPELVSSVMEIPHSY